ncbi:hypothetical protein F4802DRAFT_332336 [Xylaria palmicola]|nr:hypothetical protein F4802DRAFT_332336 [Xylaria palmicola]
MFLLDAYLVELVYVCGLAAPPRPGGQTVRTLPPIWETRRDLRQIIRRPIIASVARRRARDNHGENSPPRRSMSRPTELWPLRCRLTRRAFRYKRYPRGRRRPLSPDWTALCVARGSLQRYRTSAFESYFGPSYQAPGRYVEEVRESRRHANMRNDLNMPGNSIIILLLGSDRAAGAIQLNLFQGTNLHQRRWIGLWEYGGQPYWHCRGYCSSVWLWII